MSLRAKDVDDDGSLDLLTADEDSARIFFGDGQGHFGSPRLVGVLFGATVADAGDFDGDGHTDLVLASEIANRVGLWRSTGGRAFSKSVELDSGGGPASLATADLDGDGRLDLISASWYGSDRGNNVDVFLNDGRGSLADPISYYVVANLHTLLVAQLDRDGRPDVVVGGVNTLSVLHNTCLPGERPRPPEPPSFDALERTCLQRPLSLSLVDADYSSSLDRIVVASEQPNALVIIDPRTGSDQRVALATPPLSVSVAPAGDTAIVQQKDVLSWIDLRQARVIKQLPWSEAGEVVLGDSQFAYLFSATERAVYSIDLVNETSSAIVADSGSGITLNAKHGVIYACSTFFGPRNIEEYNVGQPRAQYKMTSDLPYNQSYPPLFTSVDGKHTFAASGAVLYADPGQARDLRFETFLTAPVTSQYASYRFIGGDLANQRTYAIQGGNTYAYGRLQSFEPEEQWVGVYANRDLSYLGKIPVPCRVDQGPTVATYGRFVYSSPKGDRIYVIATTSTDAALAQRWGLSVLDASGRAL